MILIVHAVCGFLAFQIFAPLGTLFSKHLPRQFDLTDRSLPSLAVVVASVGRSWGTVWFKIHYRIQLFVVLPLAVSFRVLPFRQPKGTPVDRYPRLFQAFAVGLGASATTYDSANVLDKHKVNFSVCEFECLSKLTLSTSQVLGFVLLGVTIFQMLVGLWAHIAQKIKRDNTKEGEVVEKRRMANWVHIFIGIVILSLGGLQVTWGLGAWDRIVGTVPTWIRVVHWA